MHLSACSVAQCMHWLQLCRTNSQAGTLQCTCIHRYLDLLESVSPESAVTAKAQIVYEKKKLEDMVLPTMVSSSELDDIVQPKSRYHPPPSSSSQVGSRSIVYINSFYSLPLSDRGDDDQCNSAHHLAANKAAAMT